jgi:hypothetical protein
MFFRCIVVRCCTLIYRVHIMGYVPYVGFATHRRVTVRIHLHFKRLMFKQVICIKKKKWVVISPSRESRISPSREKEESSRISSSREKEENSRISHSRKQEERGVGFNPRFLQVFQELAIPRYREKTLRKNKKVMAG